MSTAYIASIAPWPLEETRPLYGGVYKLQAVKRGDKPFILEVTDKTEWTTEPITGHRKARTIPGEDIAADLIRTWTTDSPGKTTGSHPGIWIVGPTPEYTPEQLKYAQDAQAVYLMNRVAEIDGWSAERRARGVPQFIKMAVEYLGLVRDWANLNPEQLSICPYCRKSVRAGAVRCEHCKEVVDFDAYAALEAKKEAAIKKHAAPEPGKPIAPPIQNRPQAAAR